MVLKVRDVAKILNKGDQCIRIGLQRGLFPFGTAINAGGNRYNYIIYPEKFKEYIGEKNISRALNIPIDEM